MEPPEDTIANESPSQCPKGSETVLLVEDDSSVRNLMEEVLSLNGYKVYIAENGLEALNVCQKNSVN